MSKFTISNFHCPVCGIVIPLPRTDSVRRKNNHIKTLYCPKCNTERKFKEKKADEYQ